jgi:hypothetical protein
MVSTSSTAKGNPAHVRMSNQKLKARRAESWGRTETAKMKGTHRTVKNRERNEEFHHLKKTSHGLGARARRRLLSGKRIAQTAEERFFLIDQGRAELIPTEAELLLLRQTVELDEE